MDLAVGPAFFLWEAVCFDWHQHCRLGRPSTSCLGFQKSVPLFFHLSYLPVATLITGGWGGGGAECGKIEETRSRGGIRAFTVGHEKRVEGRGLTKSWGKRREVVFVHEKGGGRAERNRESWDFKGERRGRWGWWHLAAVIIAIFLFLRNISAMWGAADTHTRTHTQEDMKESKAWKHGEEGMEWGSGQQIARRELCWVGEAYKGRKYTQRQ